MQWFVVIGGGGGAVDIANITGGARGSPRRRRGVKKRSFY